MPWAGLAIGAGLGLAKYLGEDVPNAKRKRALASATQRYSPWTGLRAEAPEDPSLLTDMTTLGGSGAMTQQSLENAGAQKDLLETQADWLKGGGNPQYPAQMGSYGPMAGALTPQKTPWSLGYTTQSSPNNYFGL